MPIKISGTEVIVNGAYVGPKFQNLTVDTSVYGPSFKAITSKIGAQGQAPANDTLDFSFSQCYDVLTANTTYSESNKATGKVLVLYLDTGASAYTPTFSSNIEWPNDTEPTWSDNRYWYIGLVCWDNTVVRATAAGFGGTITETLSLSGTVASPNVVQSTQEASSCAAYWYFEPDGTVFHSAADNQDPDVQFQSGIEWCDVTPQQTYYIRCTLLSSSYTSGSGHLGSSFNTWHALSSTVSFGVSDNDAALATASSEDYKIEISNDSGGTNILATGYYNIIARAIPGG